jgi:hypothetical protein
VRYEILDPRQDGLEERIEELKAFITEASRPLLKSLVVVSAAQRLHPVTSDAGFSFEKRLALAKQKAQQAASSRPQPTGEAIVSALGPSDDNDTSLEAVS